MHHLQDEPGNIPQLVLTNKVALSDITNTETPATKDDLKQILDQLKYLVDYVKSQEDDSSIQDEWKSMALVLDRLFFWITAIVSVILLIVFLVRRDAHYN